MMMMKWIWLDVGFSVGKVTDTNSKHLKKAVYFSVIPMHAVKYDFKKKV
jgi:hypothetical protein